MRGAVWVEAWEVVEQVVLGTDWGQQGVVGCRIQLGERTDGKGRKGVGGRDGLDRSWRLRIKTAVP